MVVDPGEMPQRISPVRIAGVAFCMLLFLLFVVICLDGVKRSSNAEANLHSALAVVDMLEAHVKDKCRWPSSWSELEPYRLDQVNRGNPWAAKMGELIERVDVQFEFNDILPMDVDFSIQRPVHPHTPYYPAPFETRVGSLVTAVKNCRERKQESEDASEGSDKNEEIDVPPKNH